MEQKLRSEARALLEREKVGYIVGFELGSLKFATTPLIIKDKNDVDQPDLKGRVGIVVKDCDSRSVVSLISDQEGRGNSGYFLPGNR